MQKLVFIYIFSFLTLFITHTHANAASVHIAKDSRTYHCDRNCPELNTDNVIEFNSPEEADVAGAIPCGHCKLTTGKLNYNVKNVLTNPVITNGSLGEFRHGTYPSPPLGEYTHVGIDLVAPCGSNIYSFADGQVKDVIDNTNDKNYKTLGYMVLIEHHASLIGKKFYTLYLHMQGSPEVKTGDQVKGGSTVIGKVGDTGKTLGGCHTHFEIRYFPDRFSTWGNIYGPGDQRASEYLKQNWEDPLVFFKKYPNGLKLVKSGKAENNTFNVETDKDNQEKQSSGVGSDIQTEIESNEGEYVGDLKDGVRHGHGTATHANGTKYVGGWKDGKQHGQGTYTWPSGNKYFGGWKNGKMHGQGTNTSPDGYKYVGGLKDGKYHGQGTETWPDGTKYVGEWKDSKQHGQGTLTWPNGNKYVGELKDNKPHGQGTFTYANGDKYVGKWKDGKQHGQGTLTYHNGDKYVGENKDGAHWGQGTYTCPDGTKYVGEFKYGKWHGQGTLTWPDGGKHVGEWKYGKQHGQGTYTNADGNKYVGEWKNGERYDPSVVKLDWTKLLGSEKNNLKTLDKEAFRFANAVINQHWLIVEKSSRGDNYDNSWFTIQNTQLIQMKDVLYKAKIQEITEVNRMNGIEWKGYFYIYPKFTRNTEAPASRSPNSYGNIWGKWYDGDAEFSNAFGFSYGQRNYRYEVWKTGGKWTFEKILARGECLDGWCTTNYSLKKPKMEVLP